jgi:periplasmic protein TonB
MPRLFTLVSIVIHTIVIALVFAYQTFNIGPLPMPRAALAFTPVTTVLPDIPLQAPPRATASSVDRTVSPNAAPLEAPRDVIPETGLEAVAVTRANPDPNAVVGIGSGADFGIVQGVQAPPQPQPQPQPPRGPLPVSHQGIKPPVKIVNVSPEYPATARQVRQQGIVILEAIIAASGAVETVRVLRGYPLLNQAAIDAVQQWRFTPALLNGQPVPVVMTVTVNFQLQ